MIKNIYVIYDATAQLFHTPFYMNDDNVCRRSMKDIVNDPNSEVHRHPEDFSVWLLGTYNPTNANIELLAEQTKLCEFSELKD